jgi:hypothetical protein
MSGTRALVEASLSATELGREGDGKLVDTLTRLIDEEVAQIVRENLESRKPPPPHQKKRHSARDRSQAGASPAAEGISASTTKGGVAQNIPYRVKLIS